jgi:hypothetical protein
MADSRATFVGDTALEATARIGLRANNCVKGLKINVDKAKRAIFKNGEKLSRGEKLWLDVKGTEIVKEIKYLCVVLVEENGTKKGNRK